ncbi:unnamed protein product [Amoebophrya sp. A120]|nr:unnamed protein product [Amoebophrya sp. A120]|eukprot:GSA120T00004427001.1
MFSSLINPQQMEEDQAANSQDGGPVLAKRFDRQHLTWQSIMFLEQDIPATKNHTCTLVNESEIYCFGGYDGSRNHNKLYSYHIEDTEWRKLEPFGLAPSGRNGHTATLLPPSEKTGGSQILFLGGWLGNGPLAAGDVNILDLRSFKWVQPEFRGDPPGPCNMHTADVVGEEVVLVFRGGDGRAYLNDLHALDLKSRSWHSFPTTGELPPPRANHSSCVAGNTNNLLFIFGGWDGSKRLNDLHCLDVHTRVWSYLRVNGQPPLARAGMSLSNVHGLLYLFGGSGHTTRCFNDAHVFDPKTNTWMEAFPTDSKLCYTKRKVQQTLRLTPGQSCVPERRAGHACVAVGRRLFVFGGACGTHYFEKGHVFLLDTDAAPEVSLDVSPLVSSVVRSQLGLYFDNPQFSDVCFVFPHERNQKLYAHRVLLSVFSEHFRSMFSHSWREATENEIRLPDDISYDVFRSILNFIYTGGEFLTPKDNEEEPDTSQENVLYLLRLLRAADEFCIDHIKSRCEERLCTVVTSATVHLVYEESQRYCAPVLRRYCQWLLRQQDTSSASSPLLMPLAGAGGGERGSGGFPAGSFGDPAYTPSSPSGMSGRMGMPTTRMDDFLAPISSKAGEMAALESIPPPNNAGEFMANMAKAKRDLGFDPAAPWGEKFGGASSSSSRSPKAGLFGADGSTDAGPSSSSLARRSGTVLTLPNRDPTLLNSTSGSSSRSPVARHADHDATSAVGAALGAINSSTSSSTAVDTSSLAASSAAAATASSIEGSATAPDRAGARSPAGNRNGEKHEQIQLNAAGAASSTATNQPTASSYAPPARSATEGTNAGQANNTTAEHKADDEYIRAPDEGTKGKADTS